MDIELSAINSLSRCALLVGLALSIPTTTVIGQDASPVTLFQNVRIFDGKSASLTEPA